MFENFQPHQGGVAKFGIGEGDRGETVAEGGDRAVQRHRWLMRGRQRAEQAEIDAVGALVGRRRVVDRNLRPRHGVRDRGGEVADLEIPPIRAGIDREKPPAGALRPDQRPFDGARHVVDIDQRPPGRAVGEHADAARGKRGGDEIIEHEVEPEAGREAAGGREAERRRHHRAEIGLGEPLLGRDFRARIGGERVERVPLAPRGRIGEAIDTARGGEHEAPDAPCCGKLGETQAGAVIDRVRHRLEAIAHGVVRDRGEMDDGIDAIEQIAGEITHIAEILPFETMLGERRARGQAMGEKPGVEADQAGLRQRAAEMADENRADIAEITGDQNAHETHQIFQGAWPEAQSPSR